eukprot:scaffold10795_cov2277-Chaetoceros_neogracile.AAC.2
MMGTAFMGYVLPWGQMSFWGATVITSLVTAVPIVGHPDNYIPADPMQTPAHIVPEWYFLPFYAILRSIPDKLGGVVAMGVADFLVLGWVGQKPVKDVYVIVGQC